MMERDIFEDIRKIMCCTYISDLRYCKKEAREQFQKMSLSEYSFEQIKDFIEYVDE